MKKKTFNDLDFETRKIIAYEEMKLRIQHLNFEKDRLIKAHMLSLSGINCHLKSLNSALLKEDLDYEQEG